MTSAYPDCPEHRPIITNRITTVHNLSPAPTRSDLGHTEAGSYSGLIALPSFSTRLATNETREPSTKYGSLSQNSRLMQATMVNTRASHVDLVMFIRIYGFENSGNIT